MSLASKSKANLLVSFNKFNANALALQESKFKDALSVEPFKSFATFLALDKRLRL